MDIHQSAVVALARRIAFFHAKKTPFRIYHGSTNSTRSTTFSEDTSIDTSGLRMLFRSINKHKHVWSNPMSQWTCWWLLRYLFVYFHLWFLNFPVLRLVVPLPALGASQVLSASASSINASIGSRSFSLVARSQLPRLSKIETSSMDLLRLSAQLA